MSNDEDFLSIYFCHAEDGVEPVEVIGRVVEVEQEEEVEVVAVVGVDGDESESRPD